MIVIFLILHILICIILYLLIRMGILKCSRMVMMLAWFVPVWGIMALLVLELRTRGNQDAYEEVGIEKLKINDEIHRSILIEEDPMEGRVVPLEEALLINDPGMRRELMMEVMYSNPDDYVSQLQEARMNDDTEVVHYAVTALVELQKGYDLRFQEVEYKIAQKPDDQELIDEYIELLEQYLNSGLLERNARNVQLRRYAELLEKKIENNTENITLYCKRVDACLKVGEYESAYQDIQRILDKWPGDEKGYLLLIQYHSQIKDRKGIAKILSMIEKREIYLSPKGRSVVRFWGGNEGMVEAGS